MISKCINSMMKRFGVKVVRVVDLASTHRPVLEEFSKTASVREWQQLSMYNHVVEKINNVPGDVIEFGVASGTSLMCFAKLTQMYNSINPHRKPVQVYGFDSFEGLPELSKEIDLSTKASNIDPDMKMGGYSSISSYEQLLRFSESLENLHIKKGWFNITLPKFIEENPHCTFSLIHIDCDLYESTKVALSLTIERLSPGGIILFDEIFHETFPGETSAFWEIYNNISEKIKIEFVQVKSMPWKWYARRV